VQAIAAWWSAHDGACRHDAETARIRDVVVEVRDYLALARTVEADGIAPDTHLLDPGPGIGKTPQQTLELSTLLRVRALGYPLMCAVSRKSFIGWAYRIDDPRRALRLGCRKRCLLPSWRPVIARTTWLARSGARDLRPGTLALGCNVRGWPTTEK
jgi:dihydropteroate synthase